jgi:hypothetical protein
MTRAHNTLCMSIFKLAIFFREFKKWLKNTHKNYLEKVSRLLFFLIIVDLVGSKVTTKCTNVCCDTDCVSMNR